MKHWRSHMARCRCLLVHVKQRCGSLSTAIQSRVRGNIPFQKREEWHLACVGLFRAQAELCGMDHSTAIERCSAVSRTPRNEDKKIRAAVTLSPRKVGRTRMSG